MRTILGLAFAGVMVACAALFIGSAPGEGPVAGYWAFAVGVPAAVFAVGYLVAEEGS